MPGTQGGPLAASISQPVDIEVHENGAWWPGAILGWRHDAAGGCRVEVLLVVDGVQRRTWADLADLRLPEPPHAEGGAAESRPTPGLAPPTVALSRAELQGRPAVAPGLPGPRPERRRRHGGDVTAELPVVRCGDARATSGRHRAPADPSGTGRHRAVESELAPAVAAADVPTRPIRLGDVVPWARAAVADAAG